MGDDTKRKLAAPDPRLKQLDALVGEWTMEGLHSSYPTTVVRGRAVFEWLEGGRFLVERGNMEHPDFPDSISIIGLEDSTGNYTMHYFDSRGVSRIYEMSLSDGVWKMWRESPDFSQRFTGTFGDNGNTIRGRWEISSDGSNWELDFDLTYKKAR